MCIYIYIHIYIYIYISTKRIKHVKNHEPPTFDLPGSGQAAPLCCNLGFYLGAQSRLRDREPSWGNPGCSGEVLPSNSSADILDKSICNCSTSHCAWNIPQSAWRRYVWYVWVFLELAFLIKDLVLCDFDYPRSLGCSGISGSQFAWYPKPLWPFRLQFACINAGFMSLSENLWCDGICAMQATRKSGYRTSGIAHYGI